VTWSGRTIFIGSGAFGLPTLESLLAQCPVPLVVTQPPRRAGRGRSEQPTPVHAFAAERGLDVITPQHIGEPDVIRRVSDLKPDALVVIAYGGKLPPQLLRDRLAVNLHASLLPAWRGAAPIQRAMMAGDRETGVSVISLAPVMDAGLVFAQRSVTIDADETAGELHDRLAVLGPEVITEVLSAHAAGTAHGEPQDPSHVTYAAKLRKHEGTTEFGGAAEAVVARIHGLTPWPGCTVDVNGTALRLLRVRAVDQSRATEPGAIDGDGRVRCGRGAVALLEVQPAGGRPMRYDEYVRGHPIAHGTLLLPWNFAPRSAGS